MPFFGISLASDSNHHVIICRFVAACDYHFNSTGTVEEASDFAARQAARPPLHGPRKDATNLMGTPTQTLPPQTAPTPAAQRTIHTAQLVTAMLKASPHVSDLIFSPGRAPQIEVSGQLMELKYKGRKNQ